MKNSFALALASISTPLLLVACGSRDPHAGPVILHGVHAERMLAQCSRQAPQKGEGTWRPSMTDVSRFEARLAADLPGRLGEARGADPSEKARLKAFPAGFWRQYVGLVRNGRRYIYGNFGRVDRPSAPLGTDAPTIVCDGGPLYFGAEFDAEAGAVTHWGFNGSLG